MKRVLLILIGLLISAGFTFYILDIKLDEAPALPEHTDTVQNVTDTAQVAFVKAATAAPAQTAPLQTAAPTLRPDPDPNGWELAWADEFDGQSLNMEYWSEMDRKDNYNKELQYYTPNNSYVKDGCLYLTAKCEEKDGKQYTSAMVETTDKLSLCYGRIDAKISLPVGKGLFPAFWLLPYNGDTEIDVMEMIGSEPETIYGVNHYNLNTCPRKTYGKTHVDNPGAFHVYTVEWEPDEIRWYVDGEQYYSTVKGVPQDEMYVIFTLAVGGVWPGSPNSKTVFPCNMVVDYVRIYRRQA